jgi:hypothetical protein
VPQPLDTIISVLATVLGSISIALVLDSIHSRRQRKALLGALKSEVLSNLDIATRMKSGHETVFELSFFETSAYRHALGSGALAALPPDSFHDLSHVYDLIAMHERQTVAIHSEFIPRDRGYRERILAIEDLLKKIADSEKSW